MSEYNFKFDWNKISTLGKVKVLVEQVVGSPSQEAISQAVADYIEAHPGSLSPLSPAVKAALLQIAEKVAYIDEHGEDYYDALDAALNAKALLSITAVYTQSGTVYDTDSLDSLKADLVVTAYYDDGTSAVIPSGYTLSGDLYNTVSTITVTYSGKTTTFDVNVTKLLPDGYVKVNALRSTGTQYIDTGINFTSAMKYEIEVSGLDAPYTWNSWAFGTIGTGATYLAGLQLYGSTSGSQADHGIAWFRGYPASQAGGSTGVGFTPTISTKYLCAQRNNIAWVDGVELTKKFTSKTWTLDKTFALFTRNNQGNFESGQMPCTIYSAKFYDSSDVLIHNFIPCLDDNSVPCMYDTVGQQTFYNIGTGTFEYEVN